MKRIFILLFFLASNFIIYAQASWNTKFAFVLRNDDNKAINLDSFKESYKLINVYGDTVTNNNLIHYLTYDEKTNYFILDIETVGPMFSFGLIHNNKLMVIYLLPYTNPEDIYYAVDFKFITGAFLFDFNVKDQEKIYFNSRPYYIINKINWKNQSKKLKKSRYSNDETYNKFKN